MRAFFLSLVLMLATVGTLSLTPATAEARWHRHWGGWDGYYPSYYWGGGSHWRRSWGSNYWYPAYSYGWYPSYSYAAYPSYYYGGWYPTYSYGAYYPAYRSYYYPAYGAINGYTGGFYSPWFSGRW